MQEEQTPVGRCPNDGCAGSVHYTNPEDTRVACDTCTWEGWDDAVLPSWNFPCSIDPVFPEGPVVVGDPAFLWPAPRKMSQMTGCGCGVYYELDPARISGVRWRHKGCRRKVRKIAEELAATLGVPIHPDIAAQMRRGA